MKDLIFFSHNQKKISEVQKIFISNKIKIKNLNSFKKIEEPIENGNNFFDNAKIKSKYGFEKLNLPCFADDSGFCVEALNNYPGVKSKRFFNSHHTLSIYFDL